MTVVVSSDTDIYISPKLYGDCFPTSATGAPAVSFRAGGPVWPRSHFSSHARTRAVERAAGRVGRGRDSRHMDVMAIVKVT
ncbi:hypothetical protein HEK131_13910 [Streptomyces seoulensis]|nr:hypothetical protein HEK131_13910 [Streptomyces seoulensis]